MRLRAEDYRLARLVAIGLLKGSWYFFCNAKSQDGRPEVWSNYNIHHAVLLEIILVECHLEIKFSHLMRLLSY